MYDIKKIRHDFPALKLTPHDKPLVFFDSASSTQKPSQVLDALHYGYENEYANVHRGLYELSEKATSNFEQARVKVQHFIHANSAKEIIFTKGATGAINLVAYAWGGQNLTPADEIIISRAEHHSNIVPWQILQKRIGFTIKVAEVAEDGSFEIEGFKALLNSKTKLVCVTHISNVLGTLFPIQEITALAHEAGALVLIDGCQGVAHLPVNVEEIDCDFYAFSGHKLYAPTGIGILYAKLKILEDMPPFEGGGDMIKEVSFEGTIFADPPARFEAGTPPIMQAIGLGHAIDYVSKIGMDNIYKHDMDLTQRLVQGIRSVQGTRQIGTTENKSGLVAFVIEGIHSQDIATVLDQYGIAVRAGHHCAQPLLKRFGVSVSVRASLGLYNTLEEVEFFIDSLHKLNKFFKG